MSRKIVRLTLDHLDTFRAPCRTCLFWELDPVRRERVEDPSPRRTPGCPRCSASGAPAVASPWSTTGPSATWSTPRRRSSRRGGIPDRTHLPDAVLLTMAYVEPAYRGGGLGRMLVQGMARDLIRRGGIGAVEAFGDPRGRAGRCVVPVDFSAAWASRPTAATPPAPGCGWTCEPRSAGATRSRPPSSACSVRCDRPRIGARPGAEGDPACGRRETQPQRASLR